MDKEILFMWLCFVGVAILIICVTINSIVDTAAKTPEERAILACEYNCPSHTDYCIVECVKALNICLNKKEEK